MSDQKPTIVDVARLAGVARGTVDRVVYNRGGVARKTVEKVNAAIRELGYSANPVAASLASKRRYTFACITPRFEKGEYWDVVHKGYEDGAASIQTHTVKAQLFFFDPDSVESYREVSRQVLESKPDGVMMNVVFEQETREFAAQLEEAGIPYAFVDRKIDDLDYTLYYGADPWDAGYLGAYLLTHRQEVKKIAMVRLQRMNGSDPNKLRREGFMRYLRDNLPECRVYSVFIPPHDPDEALSILEEFAAGHPDIHHYTMANSRIHLMSDFLRKHPDPLRSVVGYDDLDKNIAAVREGLVEYLVTRRAELQAYNALTKFANCIITNSAPAKRDNYMHMDILGMLNLKDYEK